MMQAPHTYAEWVKVLDLFRARQDDREVLAAMQQGSLEWQSGVADRFSKRLVDAVNARMNTASDKFQRDMSNARGAEGAIVQALLSLRKEMALLARAVDIPSLPEEYLGPHRIRLRCLSGEMVLRRLRSQGGGHPQYGVRLGGRAAHLR